MWVVFATEISSSSTKVGVITAPILHKLVFSSRGNFVWFRWRRIATVPEPVSTILSFQIWGRCPPQNRCICPLRISPLFFGVDVKRRELVFVLAVVHHVNVIFNVFQPTDNFVCSCWAPIFVLAYHLWAQAVTFHVCPNNVSTENNASIINLLPVRASPMVYVSCLLWFRMGRCHSPKYTFMSILKELMSVWLRLCLLGMCGLLPTYSWVRFLVLPLPMYLVRIAGLALL